MSAPSQLSDTHVVTFGKEPLELFMSFGLLTEIARVVEDIPLVSQIAVDAELREKVFGLLFGERDVKGKLTRALEMHEILISVRDAQAVTKWVQGHLFDFFIGAMEAATSAAAPFESRMRGMLPLSGDGSPPSPGATPSAGP